MFSIALKALLLALAHTALLDPVVNIPTVGIS